MDTSPFAYEHALRNMRKSRASSKAVGGAIAETQVPASARDFLSPLFWLYRFIIRFAVGEKVTLVQTEVGDKRPLSNLSRVNRRFVKAGKLGLLDVRKIMRGLYLEKLLYGGLTPAQKQEKRARISPHGRIAIYALRYWGTRFQARAKLSCYDHGWWRMPHTSAVNDGMWDVQLPPD